MNTHPQRRQQASKEGVDGNEKPDIIGGSQRRKPLGANDEAASATTVHYGEAALKKVLTKQ
ncbi:hypothetical protein, partial [Stenotrophomonas sp.]|uniref:hypothetical protein n=1 Tax=Stenotrophomonas sp. TaxID=69392 RepID=UPI0029A66CED